MAQKPEQIQIPGTERTRNRKIEALAKKYATLRDDRMALGEKEAEAQATLLAVMKEEKLETLVFDWDDKPMLVKLVSKEKVSVRKLDSEQEEE